MFYRSTGSLLAISGALALGLVLSACHPSHVTFHETVRPESGPIQAERPEFYMRPTVLEKTSIFMRRTADKQGRPGIGRGAAGIRGNSIQWVPLSDYRVVVHVENMPLDRILTDVLAEAEPYVGPWTIKWSLPREFEDIVLERFSLNAETTFNQFTAYIRDYILNYRGVNITFELYEAERIMVVKG
jgi:hypothetical protein